MRPAHRTGLALLALAACASQDDLIDPGDAVPSRAFGTWHPGAHDTCTQEQHDAYSVIGPDGKAYPTWHPPTGPGGCSFGHEHGREPSGSDLYGDLDGLPFGYANEMRALEDPANPRDEDHVGHKVEWENDVVLALSGAGTTTATTVCDVLLKLHQGTHSKDAFTNNLHELVYHARCEDGTEIHVTLLVVIGRPGEFERSCGRTERVAAGSPTPANSPAGFGARRIPDRTCIERYMLVPPGEQSDYASALHESWQVYNSVERADGHALAFFNPYFQVGLPSRFYDPGAATTVGRPIDVCYEVTPSGERAEGGPCAASTGSGSVPVWPSTTPARFSTGPPAPWISTRSGSRTPAGLACGTPMRWGTGGARRHSGARSARSSHPWIDTSAWTSGGRPSEPGGSIPAREYGRRTRPPGSARARGSPPAGAAQWIRRSRAAGRCARLRPRPRSSSRAAWP